jgi:hypothetical protein
VVFATYRESMTAAERRASVRVQKQLVRRQMRYLLPRMMKLLSPWYDPEQLPVPPQIQAALDFFKTHDPITASFADVRAAIQGA